MPRKIKIDGDLALAGTKSRCEQTQRGGFKLSSIKSKKETVNGTEVLSNEAKFDDALSTEILDELNFVTAEKTEALKAVKDRTPNWTFITDSEIYDSGKLKRVVIFGKKTA